MGVNRLYHLNAIRNDAGLTKALGLDQLPEETNLRRQLTKASSKEVEKMRKTIFQNLHKANQTDKIVEIGLDIDSTVATYGKQEGAEIGYNPTKKGRPSYSIKAAFIVNNGDCVNLRLDGGKSHSKTGFKEFFGNAQRTNQPEGENPSCWLSITDSSVVARHGIVVTQCREGRIANLSPKRK